MNAKKLLIAKLSIIAYFFCGMAIAASFPYLKGDWTKKDLLYLIGLEALNRIEQAELASRIAEAFASLAVGFGLGGIGITLLFRPDQMNEAWQESMKCFMLCFLCPLLLSGIFWIVCQLLLRAVG